MTALRQVAPPDFSVARFHMVEAQLRANHVRDERVLNILRNLPREEFVPPSLASLAYVDEDIEVAPGRFLLEPMILARLIQEANIKPTDRVLDLAPATGYSTAVLARLAAEVVAVESDQALALATQINLKKTNITNVRVEQGALTSGFPSAAPYDVIFINGSVEVLPESLAAQLATGGRLVTVVQAGPVGEARLYEKHKTALPYAALFNANVNPLAAFAAKPSFVF